MTTRTHEARFLKRSTLAVLATMMFVLGAGSGIAGPADDVQEAVNEVVCSEELLAELLCNPAAETLWQARYDGPGSNFDTDVGWAITSDLGTVFVAGQSEGDGTRSDYATVAYDAITGDVNWEARYDGPASHTDIARAITVADGTVFVTGESRSADAWADYATIAYDAETGDEIWNATYNGPADLPDVARAVTVDSGTVFVTGTSSGGFSGTSSDYATVAYDAETGDELWAARYDGPISGREVGANGIVVAGDNVIVTGGSPGLGVGRDFTTVAYDSATGDELWTSRYDGPVNSDDDAQGIVLSEGGDSVFITGTVASEETCFFGFCFASSWDYATVAYDVATGDELWATEYNGAGDEADRAAGIATAGDRVFVTGESAGVGGTSNMDYATIAYDAATGDELWESRFDGAESGSDNAFGIAVSMGKVYVTGSSHGPDNSQDYATVSYDAGTGEQRWMEAYVGPGGGQDAPFAITAEANTVFVTGRSTGDTSKFDYATMGYLDLPTSVDL